MARSLSHMSREALQELFARASARRAERRRFVETLRKVLAQRGAAEPMLLQRIDRRAKPR
jgi:hypothetical protein